MGLSTWHGGPSLRILADHAPVASPSPLPPCLLNAQIETLLGEMAMEGTRFEAQVRWQAAREGDEVRAARTPVQSLLGVVPKRER
jgi:hypothetical protein